MAGLATLLLATLFLLRSWLGMGMLGTRWQRRIARCLLERRDLSFQRGNALFLVIDDRLQQRPEFGRQRGQLFGGDRGRHEDHVADFANCAKRNFTSRLCRGVNGYKRKPNGPQLEAILILDLTLLIARLRI